MSLSSCRQQVHRFKMTRIGNEWPPLLYAAGLKYMCTYTRGHVCSSLSMGTYRMMPLLPSVMRLLGDLCMDGCKKRLEWLDLGMDMAQSVRRRTGALD